ncbi:MAG: pyruvate, phosphate dikinase [Phycisphaerae bacterium]|nr:pyruvate, phosphate dikinase [Phycisphaerae bacterium]
MAKSTKHVYFFGAGKAEGRGDQKVLLGGKGAGLASMTSIGLPVPAGFTITTDACALYQKNKKWPPGLEQQVKDSIKKLERVTKKKLGDPKDPLLVSVRSGGALSMPGMMETILNLGLTDKAVEGLAAKTNNPRFAWDAYRRFIQMYSTVVVGLSKDILEEKLHNLKHRLGIRNDPDIPAESLRELCGDFKAFFRSETGREFPDNPWEQLVGAINAVFNSWMADKAVTYRKVENITGLNGTGVNVQQMVFGNMGESSGTGVCFTRDPSTGENKFYGDYLVNAQGEDVVAGIRTPLPLTEMKRLQPDAYDQLCAVRAVLETHYKEMQDLEFTIEEGTFYMLQCRTGKRSPMAMFKIAVDHATKPLLSKSDAARLVKKKYLKKAVAAAACKPIITKEDAVKRIQPVDLERLFYPVIDTTYSKQALAEAKIAEGINAVPGAACGEITFSAEAAEERAAAGKKVILVRKETSPEDVGGMHAAQGILTQTGGPTSHAAVVARGWGKCCIVGCEALNIDYGRGELSVNGQTLRDGDTLTLDGSVGAVYRGALPLVMPKLPAEYYELMKWCDQLRRLKVRTNADTPYDSERAVEMGAEGIGLCRTEHMFFDTEERRLAIQEMIVADDIETRKAALAKLLPFQREDFIGIFEAMDGRPVTIRLVDPPLHEFTPKTPDQVKRLSDATGISPAKIESRCEQLHESNPMLGHRGCRLSITYPEILDMQVTAIIEAAVAVRKKGKKVAPEIMIPLAIDAKELGILVDQTRAVADAILKAAKINVPYMVGTMIETPRAALLADKVAEVAEFFSFGTNDLTQTTMALSRDDSGRFLPEYVDQKKAAIFKADPFQSLDQEGVGLLVQMGIEKGRSTKPNLKIGICGEHGGEGESVKFCHRAGMDYVSCSPFRVPIARLAAAQAVLAEGGKSKGQSKAKAKKAAAKPKKSTKAGKKGKKGRKA